MNLDKILDRMTTDELFEEARRRWAGRFVLELRVHSVIAEVTLPGCDKAWHSYSGYSVRSVLRRLLRDIDAPTPAPPPVTLTRDGCVESLQRAFKCNTHDASKFVDDLERNLGVVFSDTPPSHAIPLTPVAQTQVTLTREVVEAIEHALHATARIVLLFTMNKYDSHDDREAIQKCGNAIEGAGWALRRLLDGEKGGA